ncbi:MAG: hypothetical protein RLO12_12890 [Fulvivirga sp.]
MVFSFIIYLALLVGAPIDNSRTTGDIQSIQCTISATVKFERIAEGYLVKIDVEGDTDKMEYIFCNDKGNLLRDNSDSNTIVIKEKGNYFCVLSRNKDCFKKIEFAL